MLRPDAGVIEAGRTGMNVGGLSVGILQDVAEAAMQDAGFAIAQRGGMAAGRRPAAPGFDADNFDRAISDEWIKHAGAIAAPANAGDDDIRQPPHVLQALG